MQLHSSFKKRLIIFKIFQNKSCFFKTILHACFIDTFLWWTETVFIIHFIKYGHFFRLSTALFISSEIIILPIKNYLKFTFIPFTKPTAKIYLFSLTLKEKKRIFFSLIFEKPEKWERHLSINKITICFSLFVYLFI